MTLIDWSEPDMTVDMDQIDQVHREFVDLVNQASAADKEQFLVCLEKLMSHTKAHFAAEELLMKQSFFGALDEHRSDHTRVLRDLETFHQFAVKGLQKPARAYLNDMLPGWFNLHLMTMDRALAIHLNAVPKARA